MAIPGERQAVLQELQPYVKEYFPSLKVQNLMSRLTIRAVIGPNGIGKNTLMEASGLHIATAKTSRLQRPTDTIYNRYYDFTDPREWTEVLDNISEGNYVQIASHPATGEIYATTPDDYDKTGVNFLDLNAKEYQKLAHTSRFNRLTAAYIVTPTYNQWQLQWLNRDGPDIPGYEERMHEARESLSFCLSKPEMPIIINDDPGESGQLLRSVALGETTLSAEYQERGRITAATLLSNIIADGYGVDAR